MEYSHYYYYPNNKDSNDNPITKENYFTWSFSWNWTIVIFAIILRLLGLRKKKRIPTLDVPTPECYSMDDIIAFFGNGITVKISEINGHKLNITECICCNQVKLKVTSKTFASLSNNKENMVNYHFIMYLPDLKDISIKSIEQIYKR